MDGHGEAHPGGDPGAAPGAFALNVWDYHRPGQFSEYLPPAVQPEGLPLRTEPLRLPELTELQVVRHYTRLSQRNFSVDTGFYPLGSCTMKYNPRLGEEIAAWPSFRDLHPELPAETVQGALEILERTGRYLGEITGLPAVSLQPAAGAQGELTALLMIRAYFRSRGEERDIILVPDSAHGTNPASAAMAGFTVRAVPTVDTGELTVEAVKRELSPRVAALMLTNPNTLGLFERQIQEVGEAIHAQGGLLYYDGANLNALVGRARPGEMGFDICHLNLHKTFGTPHGGGGPGSGPVLCRAELEGFLPGPRLHRRAEGLRWEEAGPDSIGRLNAYFGHFGVILKAYVYLRLLGREGLDRVSGRAVLNANYLRHRLGTLFEDPYPERTTLHEFVLSAHPWRERWGIRALDIAKGLLDYGWHPPTIYFPLIIPEALLIEPTETEGKATLDAFVASCEALRDEAAVEPARLQTAPHRLPIGRLDETRAAREPETTWA